MPQAHHLVQPRVIDRRLRFRKFQIRRASLSPHMRDNRVNEGCAAMLIMSRLPVERACSRQMLSCAPRGDWISNGRQWTGGAGFPPTQQQAYFSLAPAWRSPHIWHARPPEPSQRARDDHLHSQHPAGSVPVWREALADLVVYSRNGFRVEVRETAPRWSRRKKLTHIGRELENFNPYWRLVWVDCSVNCQNRTKRPSPNTTVAIWRPLDWWPFVCCGHAPAPRTVAHPDILGCLVSYRAGFTR